MIWLADNWFLLVLVISAIVLGVRFAKKFSQMPSDAQSAKVKALLLLWVIEAEKTFKGGTGVIKLRWCYDRFTERFNGLASIVPFEVFAYWVDEVLVNMKHLLETNPNILEYVNKDDDIESGV